MHELAITRNIVAIVDEKAAGRAVRRVRLQVGRLSGVEVKAIEFCYELCAEGTSLEGSELVVEEIEGAGRCVQCGERVPLERPVAVCPCPERATLSIEAGEELLVKEMEIN
ncbi:MAG: hydrogenase maturation nickel metallochaperone HypA [Myxococcota bacterium]